LDEIVARYINPMAAHARDLLSFRYIRDLGLTEQTYAPGKEREKADEIIKEDKKKNPSKIHYFVSASREFPGKFMLTYLPRSQAKHEFITVTHEGYRFRGQVFDNLNTLFRWFKEHFRDPIPGTPGSRAAAAGSSRTPGAYPGGTTPNVNLSGVNPETLQRVAQSIPSHMLHSLSQAAHFQGTPGPFGYPANTPYTPSGQTPFMTPYANTPHQPQTPRYSGTPAPTSGGSSGSALPPGGTGFGSSIGAGTSGHATPQSGMFRTPATPSASRGYGSHGGAPPPSPYGGSRSTGGGSGGSYGGSRPHSQGASGSSGPHNRGQSDEPTDWKRAAEAWAQSRPKNNAQQRNNPDSSRNTPRSSGANQRFDDQRRTPRSGDMQGRSTPRGMAGPSPAHHGGSRAGSATPRDRGASRSTPRSNTSPRSMEMGDATPLYDE